MSDDFFDRLRNADPAADAQPEMESLRARVFAHVDDHVVQFTPRSARARNLRFAAAVALIVMAAGGGYWGGTARGSGSASPATFGVTNPEIGKTVPGAPATGLGGGVAANDGARTMSGKSSAGYWYGNTILRPAASIPNQAGEAMAYQLTDRGLDRMELGRAIASAIGLDPAGVTQGEYGVQLTSTNGNSNVQVGNEAQAGFWGNNWALNPYACDQPVAVEPGSSAVTLPSPAPECAKDVTTPSKEQAITLAKRALASLRLPMLDNAIYTAGVADGRMVNVEATPVFAGMPLSGTSFWVQVGGQGVFGMNGYGAHLEKATTYPIDGARDVAMRSQLRKWSAFGPINVTPQSALTYSEQGNTSPTTTQRNGRLMVQGQLAQVDVDRATPALQQQWFPGGEVLFLPAWNYSADDGSVWQMLAITEAYVDWSSSPGVSVPFAAAR